MVANKIARSSVEYLSGLTSMVAVDYATDVAISPPSRSLSCNVAGTVVLKMVGDSGYVTRYMNAGVDYAWSVIVVRSVANGTTTGMGIVAGY